MDLMMEEEFENLEIINYLRIKCIVRGFGVIMVEVREFFNQYNQMKKMFKSLNKRKFVKMVKKFILGGWEYDRGNCFDSCEIWK